MSSSAYSDNSSYLSRKVEVDSDGVIVEHADAVNAAGTRIRTHFAALNQSGDPVFFAHGDVDMAIADVPTWVPLQAVISPTNASDETIYRATLGGTNFDYTSDAGDDDNDIATGLAALIDANAAYTAEVVADTCVARSATQTPFTVATSIQGGAGGAGTIANATPEYGAKNILLAGREGEEWTNYFERMGLICESAGETAVVYLRYFVGAAQPTIKAP